MVVHKTKTKKNICIHIKKYYSVACIDNGMHGNIDERWYSLKNRRGTYSMFSILPRNIINIGKVCI